MEFFYKKTSKIWKERIPGEQTNFIFMDVFFFQEKKDGFPVKNDRYIRRYDIG